MTNVVEADFMGSMRVMNREHTAWKVMCSILKDRSIDVNDDKEVVQSIAVWGETLLKLREFQGDYAEPLFYSAGAEARLQEKYLDDE